MNEEITLSEFSFTATINAPIEKVDLEFLAKQGIPFEQFKQTRQPVSEAHNRQETPMFAASIERDALRGL